ncbi:uncharacterized protein BO97DRAFT_271455 [Aspergillus homomorphus CBS 101889]|uniref:Uncharacterized protein n=1 Tax=Aspergillus homomorphus (strain CBS 101889) TaxID=1450537 RepID=A0A395I445_ASPHC|nr:hypothetical protein BO97DRAFT_271455 [Aspergillus homomorphus CBS 101889]RAL14506.1 hypothetical protein BO97DRAFT_271455 [Aspergillus homomorphus CBS 101889]
MGGIHGQQWPLQWAFSSHRLGHGFLFLMIPAPLSSLVVGPAMDRWGNRTGTNRCHFHNGHDIWNLTGLGLVKISNQRHETTREIMEREKHGLNLGEWSGLSARPSTRVFRLVEEGARLDDQFGCCCRRW